MLNKLKSGSFFEWVIATLIINIAKLFLPASSSVVIVDSSSKIKNVDLIKESEGLRLAAYLPTANDVWTIGYGHTKGVRKGQIITQAQAEEYLLQDLAWVSDCINKYVKVPISQNEYDALASFIYNIGESNFARSSVLRWLNAGNKQLAADSFLLWNKQRNKRTGKLEVLNGLTKRRQKEKELFLK